MGSNIFVQTCILDTECDICLPPQFPPGVQGYPTGTPPQTGPVPLAEPARHPLCLAPRLKAGPGHVGAWASCWVGPLPGFICFHSGEPPSFWHPVFMSHGPPFVLTISFFPFSFISDLIVLRVPPLSILGTKLSLDLRMAFTLGLEEGGKGAGGHCLEACAL